MPRLAYTPLARRDLAQIHAWSTERFGAVQADTYVRQIDASLRRAAEFPAILRDASEVRPGLMKLLTGSHIAFVRLGEGEFQVIRILHDRMDPERWV